MNENTRKGGWLLICGSLMCVVTMGLHPIGGDARYLSKMAPVFMATHYLAIIALQILIAGFVNVKRLLRSDTAFVFTITGFSAAIIAGAIDGIALPLFASKFPAPDAEQERMVYVVIKYCLTLNKAFDYVMIGSLCVAIAMWSAAILKQKLKAVWVAYAGLLLSFLIVVSFMAGFVFTSLSGFRVLSAGLIIWLILLGTAMVRGKLHDNS